MAAKGGDANMMELLSQMLTEGYGCQKDAAQARSALLRVCALHCCAAAALTRLPRRAGALLAQRGAQPRRAAA
jgi:hypothetical protein